MLANVSTPIPPPVLEALYYISKNQKVVGPCTLDDLYSYIAYGSVADSDLVRRDGTTEWTPLNQLEELQLDQDNPVTSRDIATSRSIVTRRRVARYRQYDRVPPNLRADVVIKRLLSGFFFPPHLWKAAAAVFQDRVYSWKTDSKGFLTYWPRWVELLMALLLVANSLLWVFFIGWIWDAAAPLMYKIAAILSTGINDLQDWLSK